MDSFAFMKLTSAHFCRYVALIKEDQWNDPTPCPGWNVSTLVLHMIDGDNMATALLSGASAEIAMEELGASTLAGDVVAQFETAAINMRRAFEVTGALDRVVHHPGGDMPGARLLDFRSSDAVLHGWDLARAIGADDSIDERIVERLWEGFQPMAPMLAKTGMFGDGPSGNLDESHPLHHRLLDLVGRRP